MLLGQISDLLPKAVQDSIPTVNQELHSATTLSADELINKLISTMVQFSINVAIAILVFYVGKFIIKRIHRFVQTMMLKRRVDASLTTFVLSFIRIVLYFILIVTVIGILGVETSSFLAIFASAGVAIGMALSGTLQNFAGGVLILLLKPYRIGDFIDAQGYSGTVKEIQMFHTLIVTPDNKAILIPNGALSTSSINNSTREDYRRVSWSIGISYGDRVEPIRQAIISMLTADERVVKEYIEDDRLEHPAPEVLEEENEEKERHLEYERRGWLYRLFHHRDKVKTKIETWRDKRDKEIAALKPKVNRAPVVLVESLGDNSVNLTVRAWTRSENYWNLLYDYYERFYNELPAHGANFPFPQMDVHINPVNPD